MKQFFLLALAFVLTACHAGESEVAKKQTPPDPQQLLLEINDQNRLISTDQLADWIINEDPSLLLVDVRTAKDFEQFTLQGALNVPLEKLLDKDQQQKLDCNKYTIVFFSNDDVLAEQAWVLNRRLGCANSYVLRGGLNEWTATIMQPQEPPQTASAEEFELYRFRQAACKYFMGGAKVMEAEPFVPQVAEQLPAPKKTIPVKPKKQEKEVEEGC